MKTDQEVIDLIISGASRRQLNKEHGVNNYRHSKLYAMAARQGFAPEHGLTRAAAPGFVLKGHSDFINEETGEISRRWLKYDADKVKQFEMMKEAVHAMAEEVPKAPKVEHAGKDNDALCNLYTLSDIHLGALAWHKENLEGDWDLSIGYNTVLGCFEQMIEAAPNASHCVINECGDALHSDGLLPVTPTSGNILDSDSRFGKIVSTAIKLIRAIVRKALEKHKTVHLVLAEGNHDTASSIWLRKLFHALYEDEPRITVDQNESPYYVYAHGKTMIAAHHGHLKKNDALPLLFAAQYPSVWGSTTKRYCHTGHRHHYESKEHSGMIVTQHPTLASRDAYASRHGFISMRSAICHTYHSEYGLVATNQVCPEMLA